MNDIYSFNVDDKIGNFNFSNITRWGVLNPIGKNSLVLQLKGDGISEITPQVIITCVALKLRAQYKLL